MLLYSTVIVVGGQLCWFTGLKWSNAAEISLASSFSPIAGVIAAYLILMEAPTTAQLLGGGVILIGIVLNQIGVKVQTARNRLDSGNSEKEMDIEVGFKGI
jgi:drug/metabolite transporter (DMT)-like permease